MFKSIVLLADSVSHGKQIIYSFPEHIATPKFLDITSVPPKSRRNPVVDLLTKFLACYNYFGDYNCKNVYAGYGQEVFINCFSGSAKYPDLQITLNDEIFIGKTILFKKEEGGKCALNSFNLIAVIKSQEFLESGRYLVNFLASILQTKQRQDKIISKQIGLYDIRHSDFEQGIKELISRHHRPNQLDYWYEIEAQVMQEIRDLNKKLLSDIEVIQLLKKFWHCANLAKEFHYQEFHTHTGLLLLDKKPPDIQNNYIHKSLLFSKTDIKQALGSFYTKERARIVEKYLQSTKSFKEIVRQHQLDQSDQRELDELLGILISNNLAVFINPIKKTNKYISCLKEQLKPKRIKEFQDLFSLPFVETLKQFQAEKSSGNTINFNQVKFLLMNGLIKDISIYVYSKQCSEQVRGEDIETYQILKKYSFQGVSIEEIASIHSDVMDIGKIRAFIGNYRNHIGFYYVEAD